jgi:hypothetical protein
MQNTGGTKNIFCKCMLDFLFSIFLLGIVSMGCFVICFVCGMVYCLVFSVAANFVPLILYHGNIFYLCAVPASAEDKLD